MQRIKTRTKVVRGEGFEVRKVVFGFGRERAIFEGF